MSGSFVEQWAKAQRLKGPSMQNTSVFYRNMEEELDTRREQHICLALHTRDATMVDFSSTDVLGLSSSGAVRRAFLDVLAKHDDFKLSSHGSRLTDGNSSFLEEQERELALFHGSDSALIVNTGHAGNGAIFSVVPRPGDAIVYDELVHASVHDGMKDSLALCKKPFRHNNVDSFLETLTAVRDSQPQIRDGSRCVLIAVESVYSMDGDICPLKELVQGAKEIFPSGNAQFIIDEAHGTGVIGPRGAGLVNALGLESEIAIRLHTFGKALAASGVAPSFVLLAAVQATYGLLRTGATQEAQMRLQYVVRLFRDKITSNPIWDDANDSRILRIPLFEDHENGPAPFVTPIVPILTRARHNFFLAFHLQRAGFSAFPIYFPVVPKGTERVRLVFHASNTDAQVESLVSCICDWAQEMMEIDEGNDRLKLPSAARQAYSIMAKAASDAAGGDTIDPPL
ncbi:aminotransferase class I and II [Diaporthe helianthi]|uniref:Aminotransferase class I and II n=1 Tax=Diaporthe helianthi TaxID=158607 RepID=A0A2P5HER6_DIAHE|nr:aminotransferase class I and II [Diaporthe helianthi]